tara:strand:- start:307 stop:1815 length:1509 start_codon:yes stop_codon:yes gene_type:complete
LNDLYQEFLQRLEKSNDESRHKASDKRHQKGYRTARENLNDLVDKDSFLEFGQFAVAAQRSRRNYEELQEDTNADGIITGFCSINADRVGKENADAAAIIYDYSVLAGTQGYFHHQKLDRIIEKAKKFDLPMIIFTEGGGGRPGDVDVVTQVAGLHVPSFVSWASLSGKSLKIAVNNGYCFAGNAALFGCSDFKIATKNSWIGMAGPAMIEGGGLGKFLPEEIGPIEVHKTNGVVDVVVSDEKEATFCAKKLLSYFQGRKIDYKENNQESLRKIMPDDRRYSYEVREVLEIIADEDSFFEVKKDYGKSVLTGFIRIEGYPIAVLASDCKHLGGAVDSEASEKAADFLNICSDKKIPITSFVDTPGFMVGPDSEKEGAVRRMASLFKAGAKLETPLAAIFLRKGYGLGAQALVGGSLHQPVYTAAWPTGEFGGMGLEGAVKLGFKKELDAIEDKTARNDLYEKLVAKMYDAGKAVEVASFLEIDAVIDPADTRNVLLKALQQK